MQKPSAMRGPPVSPDTFPRTVSPLVVPEIVTLPDEVDISNAKRLGADLIMAMRPGVPVVIADMRLTEFCDAAGIRHLLLARDYACETSIDLRVVVSSAAVRRALRVTGADTLLRLYATLMAALSNEPAGMSSARPAIRPTPDPGARQEAIRHALRESGG